MAKKRIPEYRMLAIDWVCGIGSDKARVKFDATAPLKGNLGRMHVTTERDSCGSTAHDIGWLAEHGWRLQQVVIPDPVRHPDTVFGLFVKE